MTAFTVTDPTPAIAEGAGVDSTTAVTTAAVTA